MGRKRKRIADVQPHIPGTEHPTPTKAKMQGVIEFLEAKSLLKKNTNTPIPTELPTKHDIYEYFNVPDRSASRILGAENPTEQAAESSRRGYYQGTEEKRGLKGKISWRELKRMEEIVNDGNIRHRALL
ncbi:hypothetical protein ABVK25_011501 [Lepraria finkii]|uniref:Uncharacterized protein n=1 Tax=Lepraria finkii TaxID=1340010 RepID=A0ABR4AP01_9LECA